MQQRPPQQPPGQFARPPPGAVPRQASLQQAPTQQPPPQGIQRQASFQQPPATRAASGAAPPGRPGGSLQPVQPGAVPQRVLTPRLVPQRQQAAPLRSTTPGAIPGRKTPGPPGPPGRPAVSPLPRQNQLSPPNTGVRTTPSPVNGIAQGLRAVSLGPDGQSGPRPGAALGAHPQQQHQQQRGPSPMNAGSPPSVGSPPGGGMTPLGQAPPAANQGKKRFARAYHNDGAQQQAPSQDPGIVRPLSTQPPNGPRPIGQLDRQVSQPALRQGQPQPFNQGPPQAFNQGQHQQPFSQGQQFAQQTGTQQQQQPFSPAHPQQAHQQQPQVPPAQGIQQPPHTHGQRLPSKLRVRIDPDHIPSPISVQEIDQDLYKLQPYMTCSRMAAPLSSTDYVAVDQGSCNPRFARMTTYNLPSSDDLALTAQFPLGILFQPFAKLRAGEEPVPVVDFEAAGPPRCNTCRGYINPWCVFTEGGQKFVCNLCGSSTEVAPEYFSHLDMSQRRLDLDQRPELRLGSVDFVVGSDYWVQEQNLVDDSKSTTRKPTPMNYAFAIDVSWASNQSGVLNEVVAGLRELFYGKDEEGGSLPEGARVSILTYDKSVQFFNLSPSLTVPQMLVVSDLTDVFTPLNQDAFFVDPVASRHVIERLFESLPGLTAENKTIDAAIGAPLKAAVSVLKRAGGQLNLFQSSLPTVGPGALKQREDTKLYGTDKEKTLLVPQDTFYRSVAEECVEAGIGINLFLFPSQYIDAATLSALPGVTGGDLYFHPRFDPVRDGPKLHSEIVRLGSREGGYNATLRVRCSNGLRVSDHFGNFFQRNVTDLELGVIDCDKAIGVQLKHEHKLDERSDAYFQCAVLYTSTTGQRRVRVHNLAVPVTDLIVNVFRFADMDATMTYITKKSMVQALSKPLKQVREQITHLCVNALIAYRKHCATSTSPGQLILPESFKLFPLYSLGLLKTKALKGGPVSSDVRTHTMRLLRSAGVATTLRILYPRMVALHTMEPTVGFAAENGQLKMPLFIRSSYSRMEPHGAYLIENSELAILWLGQSVSPQILNDLYAVDSLEDLDTRISVLPNLPTTLSTQLRNIVTLLQTQNSNKHLPILIARQNMDGTEIEFSNMLSEDPNNDQLSYVDYLCFVHQQIQAELVGDNKRAEFDTSFAM